MGIKDKQTYGEYYWAMQAEATAFNDEAIESAFAPFFAEILADVPFIDELPAGLRSIVNNLAEPPSAGFGGFALGVGVEMVDETLHTLLGPMMKMMQRKINKGAQETWLTSEQANTLFRQGKILEDFWQQIVLSEGYADVIGKFLYQAQAPYPSISDLVMYSRYHGDPDNPWTEIQKWFDVPARDWPVWKWLGLQRLTTEQVHTGYRRGYLSETEILDKLGQIGWDKNDRLLIKDLNWQIPNAMIMVQGGLMEGIGHAQLLEDITFADIHPKYKQTYLDAVLTKPATTDLVAYHLRKDPELKGLDEALWRTGIHPNYTDVYKTLAYPIPPVADIITMAVREAFTPDVAAKFGQYEDFPPDFAFYASQKGLTEDWAKRYWAAHWSLPSPQQGFEMLHRGIVNENELLMLMKALDIMPFWRDKLMQMSFRRLTRVDVRRMYREGVLSEAEVYESYLELGYAEENAQRMSDFTVKQTLSTLSKFTSTDIVKAYTQRKIDKSTARNLLDMLGIRQQDIQFIISTADYKKAWALTDQRISAIRNLYKKKVYDVNKTRDRLSALALPAEQIDVYMEQWYYEIAGEVGPTWTTAQTLNFAKKGIISKERAEQELAIMGYDAEHRAAYLTVLK